LHNHDRLLEPLDRVNFKYYEPYSPDGNPAGRQRFKRLARPEYLFSPFPAFIEIGEFVLAAIGAPRECLIHPVAAGTDPLIL
jgi:hypothetical protein